MFPIVPTDQAAAISSQMRNIFSVLADRFGPEQASALFTEAVCAEIARQAGDTGKLIATRFAVEVVLNQAFDRLHGAIPVGFAG